MIKKQPLPMFSSRKKPNLLFCITLFLTIILFFSCFPSISAQQTTAKKYAPILYFEANEQTFPIDAQYHLDNAHLYSFDGESSTLIDENATSEELGMLTQSFYYLDNINGELHDSKSIISHYQQEKDEYDKVVYYREITESTQTILQYWFFYPYNKGDLNVHEGDWEMIQIILESNKPVNVMYSQHHTGQRTIWENADKTGSHPHVYVARGSHANYLRSFSGKLGVASDTVGDNGEVLTSEEYTLVELQDQEWLSFAGRWGEVESIEDTVLGFSGPPGPAYRENGEMWNNPITWGGKLPQLNTALLPLEFVLYHFITIFIAITLISIGLLSYRLYRRKQTSGLGPRFFSFFYIDGFNKHSIGNILFFVGIIIAIIGLVLPWYGISGSIESEGYTTEGMVDFLQIDGIEGIQITYPGANGPIAVGSFIIPFALLIGIGFIFTIFKSIGIAESKKLGKLFLWRGIGLITPFILLIIVIFSLGGIIQSAVPDTAGSTDVTTLFSSLSQRPLGGSEMVTVEESGVSGTIELVWGLGLGGYLLLIAGAVLICAAVALIMAKKTFY